MNRNWRTILSDGLTHALLNWKTTAQGVLSVLIALGVYFSAIPPGQFSPHTIQSLTVLTGALKVLIGFVQSDAKSTVNPK